ncbi:hypothetical protein [Microbacterium sp. A93]|uniref:hypothetical protein n=1 Tax=unclassified Microbacterium TaxID=2609290 RepID=UPI003F41DCE6
MNRRIAALTIATVAVLGLTACSGSPSGSGDASGDGAAAEQAQPNQSVADACAIVIPELTEASTAMGEIDPTAAGADPQAAVDQFNTFVETLGGTIDKVSNTEVKDATTAVYDDFAALSEVMSKVLVDQDLTATSDLGTITTDMTESATVLQELCS